MRRSRVRITRFGIHVNVRSSGALKTEACVRQIMVPQRVSMRVEVTKKAASCRDGKGCGVPSRGDRSHQTSTYVTREHSARAEENILVIHDVTFKDSSRGKQATVRRMVNTDTA